MVLIHRWGIGGLLVLPVFVALVGLNLATHLRQSNADVEKVGPMVEMVESPWIKPKRLTPFLLLITSRSWTQITMIAFLLKYLSDLGYGPSFFGPIAGIFMGGSALAVVTRAWLADRYGKKLVTTSTLTFRVVPFLLFPMARSQAVFWILSFIGGG